MDHSQSANSKGSAELKGLSAVEELLFEGNFKEARPLFDAYIRENGVNEETDIVNLSLLLESKSLYKVLLLGAEEENVIPYTGAEQRTRILENAKKILDIAKGLDEKFQKKLFSAIGAFIEEAVLTQNLDKKEALAYLYAFLPAVAYFNFPLFAKGKYPSVAEKIFLPKDKHFEEVEKAVLDRFSNKSRFLYGKEAHALGALYLEDGNFEVAEEYLESAQANMPGEERHKTLFLLLCAELRVKGEEDFPKAKGFTPDHPTYKKLLSSVRGQADLVKKYKSLAVANQKSHEKKPKPKKERKKITLPNLNYKKLGLFVGIPVGCLAILCFFLFVVFNGHLTYEEMPNGSGYAVSYWGIPYTDSVEIPEEYNGLPVVKVNAKGFKGKSNLKEIILPKTLETIGDEAFAGCRNLAKIELPSNVDSIGDGAFKKCKRLTYISLPYGVDYIGESAFFKCKRLVEIVIPSTVSTIAETAFEKCIRIENFNVSPDNAVYQSIDGSLYSKDAKTIVRYAIGKSSISFTTPNSVTSIGSFAFANAKHLETIVITTSVNYIGLQAFSNCPKLKSAVFEDPYDWMADPERPYAFDIYFLAFNLSNTNTAVGYLKLYYPKYTWYKS